MIKTLAIKELRESLAILAIAAFVLLHIMSLELHWQIFPWFRANAGNSGVPFNNFATVLTFYGGALAIGLGLKQSAWENNGNQYYFLLHRPLSRRWTFLVKLLVGLAAMEFLLVGSILVYALWADIPGNVPAPFDWRMTGASWIVCCTMPTFYLGAFLSGLRPGRWFGTRLMPLIGTGLITFLLAPAGQLLGLWPGLLLLAALDVLLLQLILATAETRDY